MGKTMDTILGTLSAVGLFGGILFAIILTGICLEKDHGEKTECLRQIAEKYCNVTDCEVVSVHSKGFYALNKDRDKSFKHFTLNEIEDCEMEAAEDGWC